MAGGCPGHIFGIEIHKNEIKMKKMNRIDAGHLTNVNILSIMLLMAESQYS